MLKHAFKDRNHFAPLKNPQRILDIGTGTGIWVMEMARDEFPNAQIHVEAPSPAGKIEKLVLELRADLFTGNRPFTHTANGRLRQRAFLHRRRKRRRLGCRASVLRLHSHSSTSRFIRRFSRHHSEKLLLHQARRVHGESRDFPNSFL